ncbi:MAG: ABC transporter substrate-binding protein [Gemmatimonadetes bacterium]|nr:ABC transporter substrate-binding protein [Gemmatimonadota bacterium]
MMRFIFTVALLTAGVLSAAISGLPARVAAETGSPVAGGTLIYGRGMDAVGLDPAHESDGESFKICDNVYECLVRFADDGTDVEPQLATSWTTSPDGKTWTFHLRRDVKFHCGHDFSADAVAYSIERQWGAREPRHEHYGVGGPYPFWGYLGMDDVLQSIDVLDPTTVRFQLSEPSAPFLSNLACNFAAIVCPHTATERGEEFFRHPCGTGPYRMTEWKRSEMITLEKFEDYWDYPPYLDRIVFRSIPDNSTRFFELLSGSIHMMDGIPPDDTSAIEGNRALKLLGAPGMNVAYLAMNLDHKPFDDPRVRRAVSHAIDKNAIVEGLYAGLAEIAVGPVPPNVFGAKPGLSDYDLDLDLARELLAEAGYPEGFETTLWAMSGPRPYMPQPVRLAQVLQSNLAAIGIHAKIVTYEWGTYLDRVHRGHHDMALLGWQADNGDPDNFLFVHFDKSAAVPPAGNIAFYRDERVHELLVGGQRTVDPELRLPLYHEAQELIHRDAPWVPLVHTMELAAMRHEVSGYRLHPTGRVLLSRVWLAR